MSDEAQADAGLAVNKEPTAIDEPGGRRMFDLPEVDPGMFDKLRTEATGKPDVQADDVQTQQWAREGIPPVTEPRMVAPVHLGRAKLPPLTVPSARAECPHCEGRGYVPSINDLLRESAALLTGNEPEAADSVIRDFYVALFREAPTLVAIFPGDPTQGDFGSTTRGAKQRELLLDALAGLSELYDPSNPARMEQLDGALKRFGRAHAAFARPDGTVSGATLEEYKAVKDALLATLIRACGEKWRPEYGVAWNRAYDYAAAAMLVEQHRSGFTAPRYVRG